MTWGRIKSPPFFAKMKPKIDPILFFANYRKEFGRLKQQTVSGIELLGRFIMVDPHITDMRHVAYILATVKHECADRWSPIIEYGKKSYFKKYRCGTTIGNALGNIIDGDEWTYRGRGYVQLTGRRNYANLTKVLELPAAQNLVDHPENALVPIISYQILSVGMREGLFTGKKLSEYINADICDYANARRIVNGTDQFRLIADYARQFESIITLSKH